MVASFIGPSVFCVSHIVCGDVLGRNFCCFIFALLMFGLDNDARTDCDGGGGVGVLQDGVTKTCSESGV